MDENIIRQTVETQALVDAQLIAQGLEAGDIKVTVNGRVVGESVSGSPYAYNITWENKGNYIFTDTEVTILADLTITRRPITITAASDSRIYNGTPLTNRNYTITGGTLASNQTLDRVTVTGSQTEVGSSYNIPSAAVILDVERNNVTENYAITYGNGILTVTRNGGEIIIPEPKKPLEMLEMGDHIIYIQGYPDKSVRQDNNITRAEAATIFYRLLLKTYKDGNAGPSFSDVPYDAWYSLAVTTLQGLGIIIGDKDGRFRPNDPITRAEFAVLAAKFDELTPVEGIVFSDVPMTHWAVKYIHSAYAKGWINVYEGTEFHPDRYITRSEVVSIVNNMLDRLPKELPASVRNPYNDIDATHWAYIHIMEASMNHEYEKDANGIENWIMHVSLITGQEIWHILK